MLHKIPECEEVTDTKCIPMIKIIDRKIFHFIDGSNLKLKANVTDCQGKYSIKWESSLPEESLQIFQV